MKEENKMGEKVKKELTVKWLNAKKRVVMFQEEEEEVYSIANNVKGSYLEGIDAETKVNVTTEEDVVTFIQPIASKEAKKESETTESNEDSKKWTVAVIDKKKTYIGFEESKKDNGKLVWYIIPDNVQSYLEDVQKGDVLEVKIGTVDGKGKTGKTVKKPAILFVKKDENTKQKTSNPKSENKRNSSYRDEESTDRRTATMNAKDVFIALINQNREEVKSKADWKDVINGLTKIFYDAGKNV